jgi:hypothetical protein
MAEYVLHKSYVWLRSHFEKPITKRTENTDSISYDVTALLFGVLKHHAVRGH